MTTSTTVTPPLVGDPLERTDLSNRDVRQRQIVPPQRLAACHAVVVGVGAIGRQVALQLAAVGVPRLTLIDDDHVAVENLAPQAYWQCDLGTAKVEATAEACRLLNPAVDITSHIDRFRRSTPKELKPVFGTGHDEHPTVLFACVDSITTRGLIWESAHRCCQFWVDGRMNAEVIRVVASGDPGVDSYYPTTLFAPEQAYVGACTARSTVYTATIAAGLMLSAFTRWLRQLPVERDLTLNLLASELTVA